MLQNHESKNYEDRLASITIDANLNRALKFKKSYSALFLSMCALWLIKQMVVIFHATPLLVKIISDMIEPAVVAVGIVVFIIDKKK